MAIAVVISYLPQEGKIKRSAYFKGEGVEGGT